MNVHAKLASILFSAGAVLLPGYCAAFTPETHGIITYYAFVNSTLCRSNTVATNDSHRACDNSDLDQSIDLNINAIIGANNGAPSVYRRYYDFSILNLAESGIKSRSTYLPYLSPTDHSQQLGDYSLTGRMMWRMLDKNRSEHFMPMGWIMRGSIREDDIKDSHDQGCNITSDTPKDDPYDVFSRPTTHFYDPYNDTNLYPLLDDAGRLLLGLVIEKNPAWALGADNPFEDPNSIDPESRLHKNHFTVKHAREAMYRALTGRTIDENNADVLTVGGEPATPFGHAITLRRPTEQDRLAYWATAFRSLGDVVHLIEDMAQPQHTRLDPHSGACTPDPDGTLSGLAGHDSVFESYIGAKSIGKSEYESKNNGVVTESGEVSDRELVYTGYPIPKITSYEEIWSSVYGKKQPKGTGLADYTNNGFFTFGTNLGDNDYDYPSNDAGIYKTRLLANPAPVEGDHIKSEYLFDVVPDGRNEDKSVAIPLTKESVYRAYVDEYLPKANLSLYTMDLFIYDHVAELTLPRAVAYSAAFLNYFFRGKLEIAPPDDKIYAVIDTSADHTLDQQGVARAGTDVYGFSKMKIKIKNTSPEGENMTGGHLRLVVKYRLNHCYQQDLSGEIGIDGKIVDPSCTDYEDYWGIPKTDESIDLKDEKIAVSQPVEVTEGVSRDFTEYTFEFIDDDILPINAHSLKLQVVYRGELGKEADAVVAATHDIPEPTFVSTANNLDFQCVAGHNNDMPYLRDKYADGTFYDATGYNDDLPAMRIQINGADVADLAGLPVAKYFRLGLLAEGQTYDYQLFYLFTDQDGTVYPTPVGGSKPSTRELHFAQPGAELFTYTHLFRGIYVKGQVGALIHATDNCPGYTEGYFSPEIATYFANPNFEHMIRGVVPGGTIPPPEPATVTWGNAAP